MLLVKNAMTEYPRVERFESVSVILPVMNETTSLRQTVHIILRDVDRKLLKELLIVVCQRTTPEARATIAELQNELGGLVVMHHQQLPFLGGALREGFRLARGSHVIIMSSDLETDPNAVRVLIAESEKNPSGIVTASRWKSGGSFHGYSKIKLVCNWIFQRFFSLLYQTPLTDMTFGFRIMPGKLVQAIQWEELRHPFNLESIVKPLRLGVPVTEISSAWRARAEGASQNPFFRTFDYFRIGLKVRFARRKTFFVRAEEESA
jgi:glycosyltransferase involved in cell wall biosynthesis